MTEKESPFRFLNSILSGRVPLVMTEDDEKEYKKVVFLTNRGLSQHPDLIFYANEINKFSNLPAKMQYDWLFSVVEKKKRPFKKWAKGPKDEDVKLIQEHYEYNERRAKEVLKAWPQIIKMIAKEDTL